MRTSSKNFRRIKSVQTKMPFHYSEYHGKNETNRLNELHTNAKFHQCSLLEMNVIKMIYIPYVLKAEKAHSLTWPFFLFEINVHVVVNMKEMCKAIKKNENNFNLAEKMPETLELLLPISKRHTKAKVDEFSLKSSVVFHSYNKVFYSTNSPSCKICVEL